MLLSREDVDKGQEKAMADEEGAGVNQVVTLLGMTERPRPCLKQMKCARCPR